MKKIMFCLAVGILLVPGLFADDGDYAMALGEQQSNVAANRDSSSVKMSFVRKAISERNALKEKVKLSDAELSQAYQENDTIQIQKKEFEVWRLKKEAAVAEKKVDFAYQVNELQKILATYPNCDEMKKLIKKTKQNIKVYLHNSDKIIDLQAEQKKLANKVDRAQKMGEIIRQKELLKKMQKDYSS